MGYCTNCGRWAGLNRTRHDVPCTADDPAAFTAAPEAQLVAVKLSSIVWGVFLGLWLFSLTAGIVYAILHAALTY